METVAGIEAKIAALQARLEEKKRVEREEVLLRILEAIEAYGFTGKELAGKPATPVVKRKAKAKVPMKVKSKKAKHTYLPKYGDAEGNTWTGQGSVPKWLLAHLEAGKTKEDFKLSEFDRRAA